MQKLSTKSEKRLRNIFGKSDSKESSKKSDEFKGLNNFFKFYFSYSVKSYVFLSIFSFSIILDIILWTLFFIIPSGTDGSNFTSISNSVLLLVPLLIVSLIFPLYLSWNLFAKSRRDGIHIFLSTTKKTRKFEFFSRTLFTMAISAIILFIINIINLTILLSVGVHGQTILTLGVLSFLASLFIIFIFTVIGSLISINLKNISSIILSGVIFFIFIIPVLLSSGFNGQTNSFGWNSVANKINYLKVDQVDDSGNLKESSIAYLEGAGNAFANNTAPPNKVGYGSESGFILDKLLLSPINLFTTNQFQLSKENMIRLGSNKNNSLIRVVASNDGDVSTLKGNLFEYDLESKNPVEQHFNDELKIFEDTFFNKDFIKKLSIDTSSEKSIDFFLQRLKSEGIWDRLNFSENEKKSLLTLVGLKSKDLNMFYLFRDMSYLGNKYKDLFSVLERKFKSNQIFNLIKYLWTDPNARTNILNSESVITKSDLSQLVPQLKTFSGIQKATKYDVAKMKEIVSGIDTTKKTIRIKMDGGIGYEEFDSTNFPYKTIKTKDEWDKYIDKNYELLTQENIYNKIQTWVNKNSSNHLTKISFQDNALDFYALNAKLQLKLGYNNFSPLLVTFLILLFSSIGMFGAYKLYLWKDVK